MADNINVTADADYNVSADEVTASSPARHVQRIKIAKPTPEGAPLPGATPIYTDNNNTED